MIDSTLKDTCYGMALDSIGNIYCAGFSNSDFGEENAGASDAFILKLNSSGNVLWITQLGALTKKIGVLNANEGSDYCEAITVDKNDNVYCAGKTSGNLGEVNAGAHDAFVMKLNSSGDLIWISQLGVDTKVDGLAGANQGDDNCEGVSVDDNGNVFCVGHTTGAVGGANIGSQDAFIIKLDELGGLLWAKQLGSNLNISGANASLEDLCTDSAIDSVGNIYCAGNTKSSLGDTNAGDNDAFVIKLNTSGGLEWIKQLGQNPGIDNANTSLSDVLWAIEVDANDNIYTVGHTQSSIADTNAGNYDGLILKLDTSGNILWSKQFGVTAPSEDIVDPSLYDASAMDNFQTVSVDKNGDVYVAGGSLGAMGDDYSGGYGYDVYMAKLDSSGNTIWMEQLGLNPPGEDIVSSSIYDSSKLDICLGIKVDDSGNVYCAGETTGSLGDNYADNPSNFTQSDIFILKLK